MEYLSRISIFFVKRKRGNKTFERKKKQKTKGSLIKLEGIQVKQGFGKDDFAFSFLNSSKIQIEEKKFFGEKIKNLSGISQKSGLIKCKFLKN